MKKYIKKFESIYKNGKKTFITFGNVEIENKNLTNIKDLFL